MFVPCTQCHVRDRQTENKDTTHTHDSHAPAHMQHPDASSQSMKPPLDSMYIYSSPHLTAPRCTHSDGKNTHTSHGCICLPRGCICLYTYEDA
mmetsp:Transcript_5467/g.15221  ORF Transcript_5467/g.15221 Transcript_5467/m.15221 type:complete len:93 (+) Transcript_5467:1355-1633(+)